MSKLRDVVGCENTDQRTILAAAIVLLQKYQHQYEMPNLPKQFIPKRGIDLRQDVVPQIEEHFSVVESLVKM